MASRETSAPWFKFFPADFLASTLTMEPAVAGAYIRLLCYQWLHGSIPGDLPTLNRITGGLTEDGWAEIRARLIPLAQWEAEHMTPLERLKAAEPVADRVGERIGDRVGDRLAERYGDRSDAWVHPRLEKTRRDCDTGRAARQIAAHNTNLKRWGGVKIAERHGDRVAERVGKRHGKRVAERQELEVEVEGNTPPTPPVGGKRRSRGAGGEVIAPQPQTTEAGSKAPDDPEAPEQPWQPSADDIERLIRSDAAMESRIRNAPDAAASLARTKEAEATIIARMNKQRGIVLAKLSGYGLTKRQALALFDRWYRNAVAGEQWPAAAMNAEINDPSIENIVALWRSRTK